MNDLIERQAAIDAIFSEPLYEPGMKKRNADVVVLAIYEKIKSLPSAQPDVPDTNVGDMISRQAAIKAVLKESNTDGAYGYMDTKSIVELLNKLPSAQQERKVGKTLAEEVERIKREITDIFAEQMGVQPSAQPERCEDCRNFNKARLLITQPERKKGKWIIVTDSRGRHARCPYCGEWKYHSNQKFCGECGARLEVEE